MWRPLGLFGRPLSGCTFDPGRPSRKHYSSRPQIRWAAGGEIRVLALCDADPPFVLVPDYLVAGEARSAHSRRCLPCRSISSWAMAGIVSLGHAGVFRLRLPTPRGSSPNGAGGEAV